MSNANTNMHTVPSTTVPRPQTEKPKYSFQLVAGEHLDDCPILGRERKYRPGDIIETNKNLALLNVPGFSPKFVPTSGGQQVQVVEKIVQKVVDLGTMPFPDLVKLADEEEIDLRGSKTATEALKFIRAHYAAQSQ